MYVSENLKKRFMTHHRELLDQISSIVAVPSTLPSLNPCNTLCKVMAACNLLLIINVRTFHMTYNKPIPLEPS